MHQAQDLAILFADIAGSTTLYERLGDEAARELVSGCLGALADITESGEGRVIKTIGDELMVTFPDAVTATMAARRMQERTTQAEDRLAIRIGYHFGPVIEEDGDVYGNAVNVAARMVARAKAGEIITTYDTVALLTPVLREESRLIDRLYVKGIQEPVAAYQILWQQGSDLTMAQTSFAPTTEMGGKRLRLRYGDTELTLGKDQPLAIIGRADDCDLVVPEQAVSRRHACLEWRSGLFTLLDQSTNGTFVATASGQLVGLRRDEMVLTGNGLIGLGQKPDSESTLTLTFELE